MVKQQPTDFKAMTVAAIKKYLQERGVSVNGYLKSGLVEIAVAVEKMMLPLDPNFETASNSDTWKQRLYIHEVQIDDPFSMTMKNDFTHHHLDYMIFLIISFIMPPSMINKALLLTNLSTTTSCFKMVM